MSGAGLQRTGEAALGAGGCWAHTAGWCLISLSLVSLMVQKVQVWIPTLSWRQQHLDEVSPCRREAVREMLCWCCPCAWLAAFHIQPLLLPIQMGSLPSTGSALILYPCRSVRKEGLFSESASRAQSGSHVITLALSLPLSPSLSYKLLKGTAVRGEMGWCWLSPMFSGLWLCSVSSCSVQGKAKQQKPLVLVQPEEEKPLR